MKKKVVSSILAVSILASYLPGLTNFEIVPTSEAAAPQTVWEYNYTGSVQNLTLPYKGIYNIEIYGAQGGNHGNYIGGKGGKVIASVQLNKLDDLSIYVGGQNGYNGGGSGSIATGGGATDVRLNGTSLDNRILVAGGGGAASNYGNGGNGGSTQPGTTTPGNGESTQAGTGGGGGYYGGAKGDPVYHRHKNAGGTIYAGSQVFYTTSSPGGCFTAGSHTHGKTGTCPMTEAGYIKWHGIETGPTQDGTRNWRACYLLVG